MRCLMKFSIFTMIWRVARRGENALCMIEEERGLHIPSVDIPCAAVELAVTTELLACNPMQSKRRKGVLYRRLPRSSRYLVGLVGW